MRLITYNVEYCSGINRRLKYIEIQKYFKLVKKILEKISDYIKTLNPDILGLMEIDAGTVRFRKMSSTKAFSKNLEMHYIAAKTKYARKSIYKVLNYTPIIRKNANAILSKQPLFDTRYISFSKGVKRLVIQTKLKVAIEGSVVELYLFAVHLSLRRKTRIIQLRELTQLLNACDGSKIVFGDFNIFKGLLELDYLLDNSNMINALDFAKEKNVNTFPSWKPKRHVDHILVSPDVKVKNYEVLDVNFSDHLPVMIDFELE